MTADSWRCSGGLLSLTSIFESTIGGFMFPVGSWLIYEFGRDVSTVSGLGSTTNLVSVTIASKDFDSSGVSGSLTLISGNRSNRDIGMWTWTKILRCLVWENIWEYWYYGRIWSWLNTPMW